MRPEPLTAQAQRRVADHITPGAHVIDATAGNGHDSLFLAQRVGSSGHLYSLDVQRTAIDATRGRLLEAGVFDHSSLLCQSHDELDRVLPRALQAGISAVMYNLGYLPGGNKALVTRATTTIASLEQALRWLRPGGVISLLAYVGHAEGHTEHQEVMTWINRQQARLETEWINPECNATSPRLYICTRRQSE